MEIAGFEFQVVDADGCRIIESIYPSTVDISKLSSVIATYYDLWDEEIPTAALTNLSKLESLDGELRNILSSVIGRTVLQASFVGAAWFTVGREQLADDLRTLLRSVGRPDDNVFESRDDAVAFLRGKFAERQSSGA